MPPATDEALLDATAENHRVWFRRIAAADGLDVVDVCGSELFLGAEAMIFPGPDLDADKLMREIRAHDCRSAGCWSLSADSALGTRLVARGFGWGWRPHWMAIDLDDAGRRLAAGSFPVEMAAPPYARTLPYAPHGPEPAGGFRLGVRLRGRVVGSVVVNPWDGVAGIYSMGVAPRARRRGIGAALTAAACRLAIEHGCRHAVLNATDEGTPLYARAGFRSLGWGQTWWYFRAVAPTPRQIALTEAIGFGDLTALARLRPTPAELTGSLPGAGTALMLALVTDQPAVAEYLMDRCPELAARRFAPNGATLLHLAVEHDRPAFVAVALSHGVDPEARDDRFNATALDWAEHFGREDIAAQLGDGSAT
ncbi:MAG: GNAT family N-acetyltransferase [Solirubrobacteraceae bacterium]